MTLAKFITLCEQDRLDEFKAIRDMWKHAKRGYKSGYTYWNPEETEEDKELIKAGKNPTWEKFKNKVMPAIDKTKQFVGQAQQITGVSAPLAAALLAAGITGGAGAIPMAAFLYFTRKIFVSPVLNVAGKGFDKVFGTDEDRRRKEAEAEERRRKEVEAATPKPEWHFCLDYKNYLLYKELKQTGYISDLTFKEWISNPDYSVLQEGKIMNWIGKKIGQGVGFLSGLVDNVQNKIESIVEGSIKSLANFAKNNRIGIMKAAFLMGLGVAIGHGVTKLTNNVIQQVQDSAQQAIEGKAAAASASETTPATTGVEDAVQAKTSAADAVQAKTSAADKLHPNADYAIAKQHFATIKSQIVNDPNLSPSEMKSALKQAYRDTFSGTGAYETVLSKKLDLLTKHAERFADDVVANKFGTDIGGGWKHIDYRSPNLATGSETPDITSPADSASAAVQAKSDPVRDYINAQKIAALKSQAQNAVNPYTNSQVIIDPRTGEKVIQNLRQGITPPAIK